MVNNTRRKSGQGQWVPVDNAAPPGPTLSKLDEAIIDAAVTQSMQAVAMIYQEAGIKGKPPDPVRIRARILEHLFGKDVARQLTVNGAWEPLPDWAPLTNTGPSSDNCGTGSGGFQPGNTCARGGAADAGIARPEGGFTSDAGIALHSRDMIRLHEANARVHRLRQVKEEWIAKAKEEMRNAFLARTPKEKKAADKAWGEAKAKIKETDEAIRHEARQSFLDFFGLTQGAARIDGTPEHSRIGKDILANWGKASQFLGAVASKEAVGDQRVWIGKSKTGRAYYEVMGMHLSSGDGPEIHCHEFGHHLEENEAIRAQVQAFSRKRFGDEPFVDMKTVAPRSGYDPGEEFGRKDDLEKVFGNSNHAYYAGKTYSGGRSEVLSMGLEQLYRDPVHFAKTDPEYFSLVVGILQRRK